MNQNISFIPLSSSWQSIQTLRAYQLRYYDARSNQRSVARVCIARSNPFYPIYEFYPWTYSLKDVFGARNSWSLTPLSSSSFGAQMLSPIILQSSSLWNSPARWSRRWRKWARPRSAQHQIFIVRRSWRETCWTSARHWTMAFFQQGPAISHCRICVMNV